MVSLTAKTVEARDYVENATLRAEVDRAVDLGLITWTSLAAELGVTEPTLARSFGKTSRGARYVRYSRAVQVARALGIDPVDVGL